MKKNETEAKSREYCKGQRCPFWDADAGDCGYMRCPLEQPPTGTK